MTNPYSEMYKRKIMKIEEQIENLKLFPCKISHIVDTAIKIEDASRKADEAYIALPNKIKLEEEDTHKKSLDLIKKYRDIISNTDIMCDCKHT